ncbi:MAG TPA: YHS domain-containing (seleno)protein [Alphaproteobacteria bacterium]|nr:YHS domain-containing (seleno)protein [Alphaproteobacteria bacterium]
MTAPRHEGNGTCFKRPFRRGIALILTWSLSSVLPGVVAVAQASTTERVVVNRFSGLAIEGFDPVAYFVDGAAELGSEDFEAPQDGAVWRFRNPGNRASFLAHPEIYGPQFGGYDPVDLARGVSVAGSPRFWLISGQRLYLFSREESRDAFTADTARLLRSATQRWPAILQTLAE